MTARGLARGLAKGLARGLARGSSGVSFDPLSLPDLFAVFDSELGGGIYSDEDATTPVTSTAQTIRAWTDAVGGRTITTQGTAGNAVPVVDIAGALFGKPVNNSQGLRANLAESFSLADYTIHLVVRGPITGINLSFGIGFGLNTGTAPHVSPVWTADGCEVNLGSTLAGPSAFQGDIFRVFTWRRSGSSISMYVDGILAKTGTGATAGTVAALKLWASSGSGAIGLSIASAIVATSPHTDEQILQTAGYYRSRTWYGVTSSDVVWVGDSISSSVYTGQGRSISHRLFDQSSTVDYPLNLSIGGTTIANWDSWADERILPRLTGGEVVVIWLGTNDISLNNATGAQCFSLLQSLCGKIKPHCKKIVVGTTIPRGTHNGTQEGYRIALNALIADGDASYDYVADPTVDAAFDSQADTSNATYYNVDTVHLNVTGINQAEPYFRTQIEAAITS